MNNVNKLEDLDINAQDQQGRTRLHSAAIAGHLPFVQRLLSLGADIHIADALKSRPLHYAASYSHIEVVKCLLNGGASIHARDGIGFTALHHTASTGNIEITKLLLARDAAIDSEDEEDRTPLHVAILYNHTNSVKLLLARGAKVQCRCNLLLDVAAPRGQAEVILALLEVKKEAAKQVFLRKCAKERKVELLIKLLKAGFDTQPEGEDHIKALAKDYPSVCERLTAERDTLAAKIKQLAGKDPSTKEDRISDSEVPAFIRILSSAFEAFAATQALKEKNHQNKDDQKTTSALKEVDRVISEHPNLERAKVDKWLDYIRANSKAFQLFMEQRFNQNRALNEEVHANSVFMASLSL